MGAEVTAPGRAGPTRARATSAICGAPATGWWRASTRWAGGPGPGRSAWGWRCCASRRGGSRRGLRDSKQLTEDTREAIFDRVAAWCAGWAVGHAGPEECDRLGMTAALRLATRRALDQLSPDLVPDAVVLDGTFDFVSPPVVPQLFDAEGGVEPAALRRCPGETDGPGCGRRRWRR